MKLSLATFVLFIAAGSASAAVHQMTVDDLQQICTAPDNGNKRACQFCILGVTEGMSTAAGVLGDKTRFCVPEGVSAAAMEFAVKKTIGEDLMFFPADRDLAAAGFVAAAILKAFPCHQSK
jgi:Ssp1 endopeptidase immunity protein Rap1a